MSDYSLAERLLHRIALGRPFVADLLHDIERGRFLKSAPPFDAGRHVFVTALARAGTTILMREIYASGAFGSLTYADMPFVLAPNLWAGLSGRRGMAQRERAHGDGITISIDSPEALDEPYWRMIAGGDYIGPDGLRPHTPDADAIAGYKDLIRLVLRKTGKTRYLAKNNNNILRLAALAAAMPGAVFLVPMRAPLAHAASLLRQHARFLRSDAFTRDYMRWLGHHEFGATRLPFRFAPVPDGDPSRLDTWLDSWIGAYRHLFEVARGHDNVVVVPYEDIVTDPAIWPAIAHRIDLPEAPLSELRTSIPAVEIPPHDAARAQTATAHYARVRDFALTRLLG